MRAVRPVLVEAASGSRFLPGELLRAGGLGNTAQHSRARVRFVMEHREFQMFFCKSNRQIRLFAVAQQEHRSLMPPGLLVRFPVQGLCASSACSCHVCTGFLQVLWIHLELVGELVSLNCVCPVLLGIGSKLAVTLHWIGSYGRWMDELANHVVCGCSLRP